MKIKRRNIIILIFFLVLFLSICYAVLTSSLSVNGIFSFRENVWDVHFENVILNEKSVSKELPVIGADRLSVSFNASLNKPLDIYEFSIDVVNNSSLDAAIQSINVTGLSDDVLNYIEYSITYNNGTALAVNNKLFSKAVSLINIKFKYKDITIENLSASDINISPTISINYKQDDGTAVAVANSNEWRFAYTGTEQEFTVPVNSTYKVELWGGQGGPSKDLQINNSGAYTSGNISLTDSETLYVYVGSHGVSSNIQYNYITTPYNSGGVTHGQDGFADRFYESGGGATDIRLINGTWNDFNSLKSRIMVAAGGGGSFYDEITKRSGGPGGGLIGYNGLYAGYYGKYGTGGTQTFGGYTECQGENFYCFKYFNMAVGDRFALGTFGKSGHWAQIHGYPSAAGGSGYYGGGGSEHTQGAGGGSSFISGHNGCVAIKEESTEDNIIQVDDSTGTLCADGTTDITCSYHYSGYKFTDTIMIDGNGYQWTTTKGSEVVGMPTHNGKSTMTGNDGNGYAKITYIG